VLASAGAGLPLLLVIAGSGTPTEDPLNSQSIAEPAMATVVGCVALIAAVPLTTGLAAALVGKVPAGDLPDQPGHHHA
jgi:uncharacterized membrane protein